MRRTLETAWKISDLRERIDKDDKKRYHTSVMPTVVLIFPLIPIGGFYCKIDQLLTLL